MSESTTESNKIKAIWKSIKKWDWNAIVTNAPTVFTVLFFLGYLYSILHRLSEHNFEYLKACTKKDDTKYIDLFIIEPCLFYDVACGFFFLFLLIDVGQKLIKRYKITNNQFVFLLVLELSYCIVRGQSWNDYALTHFKLWTSLYYADVIWLFGLYLIFFKCLMGCIQQKIKWTPVKITKEEKNEPNNIKGLLYDKKINEDNFQRKSFAEQLANRILATNNPEGSVAVAVTGEWASGKSTFLSYIKEYLEGKAIVIEMNPGATESKRLLVKDFFDTIAEELQSYDAAVSELVYDYVDSLLEVHENGIIKVLKKVFAFNKTNSAKERFKTLSECIKQLHQPLVIFIDDLDRLDKKETKEVLRLIRNTANFSRVIYIVAFDKDYVIAQIKTAHDETGKYLDKLFQLEVSLPFYESNKITDYLFKVLEERFGEWHRDDIKILKREALNFQGIKQQTFIGAYLNSYRDVHRLVNSFAVIYDCFKHESPSKVEIDFCDLFLLEVIRLNDIELYREIYYWDIEALDIVFYEKVKKNEDKPFPQKDILGVLVGGADRLYRLREIDYFYKYFRFRISEGDIAGKEILEVIHDNRQSKEELLRLILKWETERNNRVPLSPISEVLYFYSETKLNRFVYLVVNYVLSEQVVLPFHVFEKSFYCLYHIDEKFISKGEILNLEEESQKSITPDQRFLSDTFKIEDDLFRMLKIVITEERYKGFIQHHRVDLLSLISSTILPRLSRSNYLLPEYVELFLQLLDNDLSLKGIDSFKFLFKKYNSFFLERERKRDEYSKFIYDTTLHYAKVIRYFGITSAFEKIVLSKCSYYADLVLRLFKNEGNVFVYLDEELINTLWGSKEELKIRLSIGIDDNPDSEVIEELQCLIRLLDEPKLLSKELIDSQYSALSFIFHNGID